MRCPFCGLEAERPQLHAHLLRVHGDRLETRREGGKLDFDLNCPLCSEGLTREVNPRGRDPEFLEKYREEISLVGFDLLLYHLETHA